MPLMRSLCDELVALELGALIARGTPDEVLNHPRVIESCLGTNEAAIQRSGTSLFSQGDPGDCLHVVAEGEVRLFGLSSQGQEVLFLTVGPPSVFGELVLLDDQPRSVGARTMSRTMLLSIDRASFRELLRTEPVLVDAVLRYAAAALRRTTELAADLALLDLSGRIAKLLVTLAAERGDSVDVRLTQTDLAARVGGSRQSVNRALRALERAGVVQIGRARIVVRDMDALRGRADL